MQIAEMLTGARKTYGLNLIGGISPRYFKDQRIKTIQLVREMRKEVTELVDILLSAPNMEQRTVGVGILDKKVARDFSPVGPMIRASGFKRDVRFDHPFADYGNLPLTLFSYEGGDVFSRVMVRIKEVLDSMAMIEYAFR